MKILWITRILLLEIRFLYKCINVFYITYILYAYLNACIIKEDIVKNKMFNNF